MRSSHTLASEPFIEPEMLKRYPVTLPARLKVRNELASWLGDDIDGLNVIAYSNLSTNALTIAEKTDALVLCVEGSKPYLDHDQMVFVPLKPELTAASVIAWKKNYPFSKAVSRFIEYIRYTVNQ